MRWLLIAVATLIFATQGVCLQDMWTDRANADLDGDGTVEQIRLERLDRMGGAFTLWVNGASITDKHMAPGVDGLSIVDIDVRDEYREIAVYTSGWSDDPDTWFFSYNGSELHRVGRIAGGLTIGPGGSVEAYQHVDFWGRRCSWRLNHRTNRLEEKPQSFYAVNVTATVRREHPVYSTSRLEVTAGQLQPGTSVTIAACKWADDHADLRYIVVLPGGETGWLSSDQVVRSLRVPLAD